jgi:hypothetical protein
MHFPKVESLEACMGSSIHKRGVVEMALRIRVLLVIVVVLLVSAEPMIAIAM